MSTRIAPSRGPRSSEMPIGPLTIPIVECHLSNPAARERFRHRSYVSPVATGVVSGFGPFSYELAVRAALRLAQESQQLAHLA